MKRFFTVLGGITAALVVLAAAAIFLAKYFRVDLDQESKSYVDANLPPIVGTWNPEELIKRSSPEFLQVTPPDKIEKLFGILSQRLGPLKEYRGSRGRSKELMIGAEEVITGDYKAEASFANGPAQIDCRVIKHDGQWQILEFWVDSNGGPP
ncbi:MAG: hypothetical protein M0017_01880 [Desulfobacteraceae bacterium]|nr:hypothetical protein [Desulfobacteraceae bacterium]